MAGVEGQEAEHGPAELLDVVGLLAAAAAGAVLLALPVLRGGPLGSQAGADPVHDGRGAQTPREKVLRPTFSWTAQVGPAALTRRVSVASPGGNRIQWGCSFTEKGGPGIIGPRRPPLEHGPGRLTSPTARTSLPDAERTYRPSICRGAARRGGGVFGKGLNTRAALG
jgi:hypothetical protein